MKIEKQFTVAASQEHVWAFITDPSLAGPCIPGCKDVQVLGPGRYRATVQIQVGPIKATFVVVVEARVERPPEYAEYSVQGDEGGASRITAVNKLSITRLNDTECEVNYASEVNVMGRLGKFGSGVMQKIADKVGEQFAQALREGLKKHGSTSSPDEAGAAASTDVHAQPSTPAGNDSQEATKGGLLSPFKGFLRRKDAGSTV